MRFRDVYTNEMGLGSLTLFVTTSSAILPTLFLWQQELASTRRCWIEGVMTFELIIRSTTSETRCIQGSVHYMA